MIRRVMLLSALIFGLGFLINPSSAEAQIGNGCDYCTSCGGFACCGGGATEGMCGCATVSPYWCERGPLCNDGDCLVLEFASIDPTETHILRASHSLLPSARPWTAAETGDKLASFVAAMNTAPGFGIAWQRTCGGFIVYRGPTPLNHSRLTPTVTGL